MIASASPASPRLFPRIHRSRMQSLAASSQPPAPSAAHGTIILDAAPRPAAWEGPTSKLTSPSPASSTLLGFHSIKPRGKVGAGWVQEIGRCSRQDETY